MIDPRPFILERDYIRLERLCLHHGQELGEAVADGKLWNLWVTGVPEPKAIADYIQGALNGHDQVSMLPWVMREIATQKLIGNTRYHDIVREIDASKSAAPGLPLACNARKSIRPANCYG